MNIPEEYCSLLRGKGSTTLSVICKDGSIQSSLVWNDYEKGLISIGMLNTSPKFKRLLKNEKATVLKYDSENEEKYISVRCSLVRVDSDENAIAHLNKLTKRHYGKESWYGDVVPDNEKEKNNRVVVYLKPEKVYFT